MAWHTADLLVQPVVLRCRVALDDVNDNDSWLTGSQHVGQHNLLADPSSLV